MERNSGRELADSADGTEQRKGTGTENGEIIVINGV
jgi:hypothetical protein